MRGYFSFQLVILIFTFNARLALGDGPAGAPLSNSNSKVAGAVAADVAVHTENGVTPTLIGGGIAKHGNGSGGKPSNSGVGRAKRLGDDLENAGGKGAGSAKGKPKPHPVGKAIEMVGAAVGGVQNTSAKTAGTRPDDSTSSSSRAPASTHGSSEPDADSDASDSDASDMESLADSSGPCDPNTDVVKEGSGSCQKCSDPQHW